MYVRIEDNEWISRDYARLRLVGNVLVSSVYSEIIANGKKALVSNLLPKFKAHGKDVLVLSLLRG